MQQDPEDRIKRHAQKLWEAAGSPEGKEDAYLEHARQAELGEMQPAELVAEPEADPAKFAGF